MAVPLRPNALSKKSAFKRHDNLDGSKGDHDRWRGYRVFLVANA